MAKKIEMKDEHRVLARLQKNNKKICYTVVE